MPADQHELRRFHDAACADVRATGLGHTRSRVRPARLGDQRDHGSADRCRRDDPNVPGRPDCARSVAIGTSRPRNLGSHENNVRT